MNNKAKRRLAVTGGIVAIAMLVIVAIAGSGGSASSLTVEEVTSGAYQGKKVQVTGVVQEESIENRGSEVLFSIASEEGGGAELRVSYDGALPATFGAGVVAICTGTVENPPFLVCTEMVTKCPSKYESAEGALTVKGLFDRRDAAVGERVKLCGYVQGDVQDAGTAVRFEIESQGETIGIVYDGGLDAAIVDGTAVVVEGALGEDGLFHAVDQPAIDSAIEE